MFTGIVAGMGTVVSAERTKRGLRLALRAKELRGVKRGESVCVAGCCLTATVARAGTVVFELMPETLRLTRFGALRAGDAVNLERSLRFGDRVSGHFVQGHVDGLGTVVRVRSGADHRVAIEAPKAVARFLMHKGSIAMEGVSLTVAALRAPAGRDARRSGAMFEVALIPETLSRTTLAQLRAGDRVHLEADIIGKYALRARGTKRARNALKLLGRKGWHGVR